MSTNRNVPYCIGQNHVSKAHFHISFQPTLLFPPPTQMTSADLQPYHAIRQAHLKCLWLNVIAKMLQLNKTILAMIYGSGEEKEL